MSNRNTKDELLPSAPNIGKPLLCAALIHFGAKSYDKSKVSEIKNYNWMKPEGGLWTSPINSEHGWKDWCHQEDFRECNNENSFKIMLYEWAKICIINNYSDLVSLPYYQTVFKMLDFEKIAKKYDAIWLTIQGLEVTKWSEPSLYGWDCESVLILNPECCYEVS